MAGQNLLHRTDTPHTSGRRDAASMPNPLSSEPTWSFDGTADTPELSLPLVRRRPTSPPQNGSAEGRSIDLNRLVRQSQASPNRQSSATVLHMPANSYAEEYQAGEEIRMRRQARRQRLATAPLGTLADAQDPAYESPLAGMMGRAWTRYREAEERRTSARRAGNDTDNTDSSVNFLSTTTPPLPRSRLRDTLAEELEALRVIANEDTWAELTRDLDGLTAIPNILRDEAHQLEPEANPIDIQDRPPSVPSEQLQGNIGCTICHEQVIDTLLEPCMHVAICRWCAAIMQNRIRENRRRRPPLASTPPGEMIWRCPVCRHKVQHTKRIYLGLSDRRN
jgi:hypothetical protein